MVFPSAGMGGEFPTSQKFAHPHQLEKFSPEDSLPTKFLATPRKVTPPLSNNFHVNPIKTSFLAVVIAPVPFLF